MKNYLIYSFIAPFQSKDFGAFSLAALLGTIGYSLVGLIYAFDMSTKGLAQVLEFYITTYAIIGLLVMPFAFLLYTWVPFRVWRRVMLGITLIPLVINYLHIDSQIAQGVILGIVISPFWVLFHTVMMEISGRGENKGNSISLSLNMVSAGGLIGLGLATYISTTEITLSTAATFGAVLNTLCTYLMCRTLRRVRGEHAAKDPEKALKRGLWGNKRRMLATIIIGMSGVPSGILWPLFILHAGLTFVAAGLYETLSCFLRFCVSGHVGRLNDKNPYHAIRFGGFMFTLGKLPWLIAINTKFVPVTILIWSVARHFQLVGLSDMWYRNKTLGGLASLEILLAVGRITGLLIFVPLLFTNPMWFVVGAIAVYLLTILFAQFAESTISQ